MPVRIITKGADTMGHQANLKLARKQIVNIARQEYGSALQAEAVSAMAKDLMQFAAGRLDEVSKNVDAELKKIDGQTQTFRSMLMRDVSFQISKELFNTNTTLLAWQTVLAKRLGITDMTGLENDIAAEKAVITAKLEAEAKAAQEAADKQAKEEAEQAAAAKAHAIANPENTIFAAAAEAQAPTVTPVPTAGPALG